MEKTKLSKEKAARWLRGSQEVRAEACSVPGCETRPTIAVAGDDGGATRMCTAHALAWSESNLCRDVAQHNSGASPLALSLWLSITHAEAAS
jgi:hypothetical protein